MPQRFPHLFRIGVEVSQCLVAESAPHILQAARQFLGQWPHSHALELTIHDDGAGCQALWAGKYA